MRAAGIAFRKGAPLAALIEALTGAQSRAGGRADLIATAEAKALAPQARDLAKAQGLPLLALRPEALLGQQTITRSPRVLALWGTGSLAEAAALAAAGPGATLSGARFVSADGTACAAIAEGLPK